MRSIRPLHLCLVIDELATGGTEKQVRALATELKVAGIETTLVLLKSDKQLKHSCTSFSLATEALGIISLRTWKGIKGLFRFIRLLQHRKIDLLQVYFRDSMIAGIIAGTLGGVPIILRMRNNLGHDMTKLYGLVGTALLPWYSGTVSNCEACRQSLLIQEPRIQGKTNHIVRNGVELTGEPPGKQLCRQRNWMVGTLANLRSVKGLETLVEAARLLRPVYPGLRFAIAGEGPERQRLQTLIDAAGVTSSFQLRGFITPVSRFLSGLDIAVCTSYSEGLSNAVLEYMAHRLPIVATSVGGNTELVCHMKTGLLIPPGQADFLAQAICFLLEHPFLAQRLAANAFKMVSHHYTRSQMVNGMLQVYRSYFIH